eukprot:SAG11_NODE_5727_length_1477_cov_7.456459_2_plen_85_part_00
MSCQQPKVTGAQRRVLQVAAAVVGADVAGWGALYARLFLGVKPPFILLCLSVEPPFIFLFPMDERKIQVADRAGTNTVTCCAQK